MMVKNPVILSSLCCIFIIFSCACVNATPFPSGCRPTGYVLQHRHLLLTLSHHDETDETNETRSQTLYFIHNVHDETITLKASKSHSFTPTYENIIDPNQWAAFALDQPALEFSCFNDHISVSCLGWLMVCEYNHAKFAEHNQGTYWMMNSGTQDEVIHAATHNGILLKW